MNKGWGLKESTPGLKERVRAKEEMHRLLEKLTKTGTLKQARKGEKIAHGRKSEHTVS